MPDVVGPADAAIAASSSSTWKGIRRFYNRVDAQAWSGSAPPFATPLPAGTQLWEVVIEGRALRTHAMHELLLPSESLARAIAAEFAMQGDTILPTSTPLYNLACSAIDSYAHEDAAAVEEAEAEARASRLAAFDQALGERPSSAAAPFASRASTAEVDSFLASGAALASSGGGSSAGSSRDSSGMSSSVGSGTPKLRDLMLDFLETDTVCYRIDWESADPAEQLLRKRQDKYYDPLVAWFNEAHGCALGITLGLGDADHPDDAYIAMEDVVDTADPFLKAALQSCVGALKSSVLSLAFVHGRLDAPAAFDAARVEEEWQIAENGFVEDGHDTARAGLRLTLSTAATFLGLLRGAGGGGGAAGLPLPLPSLTSRNLAGAVAVARTERAARVTARRAREAALVAAKREEMRAYRARVAELDAEAEAEKAARAAAAALPPQP